MLQAVGGEKRLGQKVCCVMLPGTSMGNHGKPPSVNGDLWIFCVKFWLEKLPGHNGRHPHGLEEIHILRSLHRLGNAGYYMRHHVVISDIIRRHISKDSHVQNLLVRKWMSSGL